MIMQFRKKINLFTNIIQIFEEEVEINSNGNFLNEKVNNKIIHIKILTFKFYLCMFKENYSNNFENN
jgi:hypothetical protein